jgi:glucokinase
MILAGDIGGTKTVLGLFNPASGPRELVRTATYVSNDYPSLPALVADFMSGDSGSVEAACFGFPGPVVNGRAAAVNVTWTVDTAIVSRETDIPKVELINDLTATAEGIAALEPREFAVLQAGQSQRGNCALVAPGTGLGMSILVRDGDDLIPSPSEGGHADFAPREDLEIGLLRELRERFGRVSVERVLSGPGLVNIYSYLRNSGVAPEDPAIRDAMRVSDPAAVIGRAGVSGESELCVRTLQMFAAVLGATAGNLALIALSTGGVYIGGGIPPKILPRLTDGTLLSAFLHKGRFSGLLQTFPLKVILNDKTALLGAARRATKLAST